jgi:hypothetical protein
MDFNQWIEQGGSSLTALWYNIINVLPSIIGAVLLLLIGWILAKVASYLVKKLLQTIQFDTVGTRIMAKANLDSNLMAVKPSTVVAKFVYWIILLVFLISAFDTLGLTVVSESISNLINYLPKLFSAIIIFVIGLYIAGLVRKFLKTAFDSFHITAGSFLSQIAFYIIIIIVGTTALDQAGIDTTLITANISIILGGIILAFAIAFGYGSRDIFANILASYYAQNNLKEGQHIIIDNQQGEIISIDTIQTVIKMEGGELIIPTKRLISETIKRV